jgi:hypothetical protein
MKATEYLDLYYNILSKDGERKAVEEIAVKLYLETKQAAQRSVGVFLQSIVEVHQKWNAIARAEPEVFRKDGLLDFLPHISPSIIPVLNRLRQDGKLPMVEGKK